MDSPAINSNSYVEKVTTSLVREYLYKKHFKSTLRCLYEEEDVGEGICDSRVPLARELHLESLLKDNKLRRQRLESMLEIVVKAFLSRHQQKNYLPSITKTKSTSTQTKPRTFSVKNIQTEENAMETKTVQVQTDDLGVQCLAPPQEINNLSPGEMSQPSSEKSYSSDFLDPQQVASPPSTQFTPIMSQPVQASNKTGRSQRSFFRSHSSKSSLRDEKEDEEDHEYYPTNATDNPSPPNASSTSPQKSFETEFQVKRPTAQKTPVDDTTVGKMSLAESLLQSKQNILAQGSLTHAEINRRSKTQRSFSEESQQPSALQKKRPTKAAFGVAPPEPMELCDIEDEDLNFGGNDDNSGSGGHFMHIRNIPQGKSAARQLDLAKWRQLKVGVVGKSGFVQDGWVGQGFTFNPQVPYGLVQRKGGPCGVLAVVQALLLRNLMFGSEYCSPGSLPMSSEDISCIFQDTENSSAQQKSSYCTLIQKRSEALRSALVEILWRCAEPEQKVTICLQGNEPGAEIEEITTLQELQTFVDENLYRLDCLGLVYSATLTRGIDRMQEDMDFPDSSPLIVQHGYCAQELVNLLLHGKAISNVFDNQVSLDGKTLHGISSQSDIGFLSLFEHYGSCEVGSFMKSPKFPVWIVCSESHFSVLFSPNQDIVSRDKEQTVFQHGFDLFYYDGLAKQHQTLRLTISFESQSDMKGSFLALPSFPNCMSDGTTGGDNDHLIPPLEKCIRTKWKNASVCWNGVEPLL